VIAEIAVIGKSKAKPHRGDAENKSRTYRGSGPMIAD
jgi:hypothetical protein